ncbi:MAG: diguanylate cyclase [Lachnospiraceae bacterium]|nr:diguanylate cyclase [Lachnospiraceae bacterium]
MIQNLLDSFVNFIMTDVQDKKETKEQAVLVRIICCIFMVYYLVAGIAIAFIQHYYLGLLLVGAIGLLVVAFICTYENRTRTGLVLLNIILLVFSTLLALYVGFDMDFHLPIFLNILLIYFNKTEHMLWKRLYTFFICAYLMCMTQFCSFLDVARVPDGFARIFIQSLNMLAFSGCIGAIAYSYCTKFNQAEEKLRRINDNLERMANLDTLTGLSNRRHMNEHMDTLVAEYNRNGKIFTVAIGDVDFFKKVNDTYGHDTGDYVLSKLANQFRIYMHGKGHVARWGGEEFLFTFENMNIDKAYKCMDELRQRVSEIPMQFKEYDFQVTMTYGMEEFNDRLGVEATINRADEKLYKGKTGGRNRVVI